MGIGVRLSLRVLAGTIHQIDTDGNELSDSVEINLSGTSPLLTDSDMDGCGDAEFFGGLCGTVCAEDLNGDGTIGTSDILQLLSVFGTMCP